MTDMIINKEALRSYYNWALDNLMRLEEDQFDMGKFCSGDYTSKIPSTICGTSACFLGYAIFWKAPAEKFYTIERNVRGGDTRVKLLNFWVYGMETFGLCCHSDEWMFLFGSDWQETDNTVIGAIKRLKHLIDNDFSVDYDEACVDDYYNVELVKV